MEAKVIIVSAQKSNKSENTVWAVAITGEEKAQAFCKSAYKAMRFAFMLKKRTGLNISDNCLSRLSKEIAEQKADKAAESGASGRAAEEEGSQASREEVSTSGSPPIRAITPSERIRLQSRIFSCLFPTHHP